ncbi:hypothetical protein TVAG_108860 [Trichomonas vaginalis G3]|uniref:Isochorismatase-like domain-containing protein n=1 Tax=Trichomonas vaginalis (strain ATCC PRA-98 / G3) TaxID=412133 RepID=A2F027_TRIV3|nr:isochorismatase family [Trichomonas vaginalis G3]EAY01729.1 hypothetical protein TVAG_108860 [Trichomonas vaginalis G3]KAI5532793.1 isochorismatase family [Trichomonas vaginalis G3]|eukprot:XP_001314287.1 hypothetical protein [Trichomonas vaginalis G3]
MLFLLSLICFSFKDFKSKVTNIFSGSGKKDQIQISYDIKSEILRIPVQKRNESGTFTFYKNINISNTVAYVDMWRSHWCTYYNDREFFFTPRINEMLQRLRNIGITVVTISSFADRLYGGSRQRKRGFQAVRNGMITEIADYEADQYRFHHVYIPGFKDICVYKDLQRFGETRDNRYTYKIALARDDYFVQNFEEAAESFVGLNKKTVIFLGQHTNMCLMAVMLYCQQANLDLIIVGDLVDSCWVFEKQKDHCPTHTTGNRATNNYFETKFGVSVKSYDLIRAIQQSNLPRIQPKYQYFTKTAWMFDHLDSPQQFVNTTDTNTTQDDNLTQDTRLEHLY